MCFEKAVEISSARASRTGFRDAAGSRAVTARIFLLPMVGDRLGHFGQPVPVFGMVHDLDGGKKFNPVGRGIAQRLEQPGGDQHRDIMRLAVQHPGRLLRRQPGGQSAQQSQKLMLILSHPR